MFNTCQYLSSSDDLLPEACCVVFVCAALLLLQRGWLICYMHGVFILSVGAWHWFQHSVYALACQNLQARPGKKGCQCLLTACPQASRLSLTGHVTVDVENGGFAVAGVTPERFNLVPPCG
jgi:hypothetical protein